MSNNHQFVAFDNRAFFDMIFATEMFWLHVAHSDVSR